MKVLLMLGYLLWEGVQREVEWNKTQHPTETYIVCWLDPIVECKTLVFFSTVNIIYMLLHIYILYSSRLDPGLPHTLCHLSSFHFSFILPGEIISSHAVATQNKVFPRWNSTWICWRGELLLRGHQKSTWMNRKPCCALQVLRPGLWVPAEQPGLTAHRWPGGEPCGILAHDHPETHPPQSPNLEITVGIFFKKYLLTVLFDFL